MKIWAWVLGAVLVLIAIVDRVSKLWALRACQESFDITSWLRCDLVFNRGVSFGMFHADDPLVFAAVSLSVILLTLLVIVHAVMRAREGYWVFGELCIVVGSLSNVIDRFLYKGVIDFIVVHCKLGIWPAYNISDALIVGGVFILMLSLLRER